LTVETFIIVFFEKIISPLLKKVVVKEFILSIHYYLEYISHMSLYFKIFKTKFFLKILLTLSPKLVTIISLVIDNTLQLVAAFKVLDLIALAFPITALTPTLSPAFKNKFFYTTVTTPSCTI
jgi:hypothetical protein